MPRPLVPERRRRILAAAEALVLDRGFDAASVQAIAERAGIAKGAVYREFDGKHAVVAALLRRAALRVARAARAGLGDAHPRLSDAYAAGLRALLEEPLMVAALLDDRGVLGGYVDAVADDRYRRRHRAVVGWVAALHERGGLDPLVDPEALALVLSSTTLGLLGAARHLGPVTAAQLAAAVDTVRLLVSGVER